MKQNDKFIVVRNKETGKLSSIRSLSFDPAYFEYLDQEPTKVALEEPSEQDTIQPAKTLEELNNLYEAKFNKRPVGKWKKDRKWLESKIAS